MNQPLNRWRIFGDARRPICPICGTPRIATLMLVKNSADQIADRGELLALVERQLVAMEQLAGGAVRPRVRMAIASCVPLRGGFVASWPSG
jgi:hypothetical protein